MNGKRAKAYRALAREIAVDLPLIDLGRKQELWRYPDGSVRRAYQNMKHGKAVVLQAD
jgi:hypothetical protein